MRKKKLPNLTTSIMDTIRFSFLKDMNKKLMRKLFRKYLKDRFDPVFERVADDMIERYFNEADMIFFDKPEKSGGHTVGITMRRKI